MPTKTLSIISSIVTAILLIIFAVFAFFIQLVALNGYSESDGGAALIVSIVCQGIGLILSAILAGWLTRVFITKFNWNNILAVVLSVIAGILFGGGLVIISLFLSIFIAGALS
jgi:hypothetical protein